MEGERDQINTGEKMNFQYLMKQSTDEFKMERG